MIIINLLELYSILLLANVVLNYINSSNRDMRKHTLFGLIICSTYISNFHIMHVLFNTFIVFLIDYKIGGLQLDINNIKKNCEYSIEYLILYKDSQLYKIDICKQIIENIKNKIMGKDDLNYDLFVQLLENSKRLTDNPIIEDYIFNNDTVKKNNDEQNDDTNFDNEYNIIENFY
jgi:hypothetical protein